ncbi:ribokinase [Paenibacillus dokdonensis]|uniref:Ribokinase n=1 Tax=Paenibacillus dokdonensis TaxID=2567944 RepID=A0ABU6GEU4_9BACL|nr:ribokinase [Paenibacillus dokdonensis]MEC0238261.1 ribokinase [Paenibacillus dokdonensis]
MKIIVIGSANMDMVMETGRIPHRGETIHGERFFLASGGKGANQAVACARMGADTWLLGKVGDDLFGKSLVESLTDYGVKPDFIAVEPDTTSGVAVITVCEGDNAIILDSGANAKVTPAYIRQYEEELLSADAVLLQLEIPLESVYEAIRLVKGKVPVFLNPAPAVAIDEGILQGVDYFMPNEHECAFYTGQEIHGIEDALAALDLLRAKGIRYPLITLGDKGVVYYDGSRNVHKEGRKVSAVDTTAAGDTFAGTLAAMICSGKSMDEAVDLAQQAASIAVTRSGAQHSIPSLSELI